MLFYCHFPLMFPFYSPPQYIGTDRDEMNHKTCLCREVVSEFNVSTKSQALMMIKDRSIYAGSSESVEEPSCVEKSLSDVKSGGGKEQRLKRVRMMMLNRNKQNATMKLHDFTKNSLKDLVLFYIENMGIVEIWQYFFKVSHKRHLVSKKR